MFGELLRLSEGTLSLRVLSSTGRLLRETSTDVAQPSNKGWLKLRFAPIVNSASIPFFLEFALNGKGQRKAMKDILERLLRRKGIRWWMEKIYIRKRYGSQDWV
jgi:hypothetical protein